ncbi:MAG: PD-(D/E)XK nuclease family protein [Prevotella sp.]|nr:PD-(D/E)XK nuclease family protein [Prevotella sp.]
MIYPSLDLRGREPISDIADHSARFTQLLEQTVSDMFSPALPFSPTTDLRVCRTCPYAPFCRR